MKRLRNRNILLILALLAVIAAVAALGLILRPVRSLSGEQLPGAQTAQPTAGEDADQTSDAPLYLLVTAGGTTYEPIPLTEEGVYTLTQGENTSNTIHVTPEAVWMEASTCENQDCVQQGEVTLDNRASRLLGNMIICLPNQVQLELFTRQELVDMVLSEME